MYHVFRDVAKGQEVAGAIKGDTQVSCSCISSILSSNVRVVGWDSGWAVWPGLPHLSHTVCIQDDGDREQGGHIGQLCRGQEHSTMEDTGWVWIPVGSELSCTLPPHMATPASHQESIPRGQDNQRVMQAAQENHGGHDMNIKIDLLIVFSLVWPR